MDWGWFSWHMGWLNLANQITRGVHDEFYSRLNPHINIQTNISLINWQIFDIQIHYEYLWILDSPTNSIHINIHHESLIPCSYNMFKKKTTHQLTSAAPYRPPDFRWESPGRRHCRAPTQGDLAGTEAPAGVVTIDSIRMICRWFGVYSHDWNHQSSNWRVCNWS